MGLYPSDEICFTYTNTKDNTWFQLKTISGTRRELSFYYNEVKLVPDKLNSCHNTCLLVYLFPSLLIKKQGFKILEGRIQSRAFSLWIDKDE